MTTINDIVNVSITRETRSIQRASFAIPCFIASHVQFSERAKEYNSIDEITDDGFATTSNVYKAASKYFSQEVAVDKIIIGRRQVDVATLTPTVANNAVYSFKLNGTTISYTSDSSATAAEIVAGLQAAITTAGITDPVDSGSTTLILTLGAADGFTVTNLTSNLAMVLDTSTEAWGDTIDAVRNENNEWYCVSIDSRLEADFLTVAAYVEAIKATSPKLFVFSSSASAIKTSATNDIFSQMKALNYEHTAYIWKGDTANYPECALVGRFAPEQAGSNVWEQKTLIGTTVDNLTSGEANYILGKNGSTYERVGGFDVVVGGKVAFGEWCDVIIFVDYLKARLQENTWFLLVNTRKVGYTAAGAASIEASVRQTLAEGIQVGGLASDPEPVVTVPNVLSLSSAQRASRVLPNVTFTARLAGAIRAINISGTVYA